MKKWKKSNWVKRFLSATLAIAMAVTMLPMNVAAANKSTDQAVEKAGQTTGVTTEDNSTGKVLGNEKMSVKEVTAAGEVEVQSTLATVLSFEMPDRLKEAYYHGGEVFEDLALEEYVKVTVDGKETAAAVEDLTFTWKKAAEDGSLTALEEGTTPREAGTYNLSIELKAKEGEYQAAVLEGGVTFVVKPAKVYLIPILDIVQAGSEVSEIVLIDIVVDSFGYNLFSYTTDNPETKDVNEAENSDFTVSYTVREAYDEQNTVLPANTILTADKDYIVDFTAEFTEKGKTTAGGNYEITAIEPQVLPVTDLVPAIVHIEPADSWKEEGIIKKTYTGQPVAAPVKNSDYKVIVGFVSGNDENGYSLYEEIPAAEVTEEWYQLQTQSEYVDAEGHLNNSWQWVKLETAPTEAGSYVYRISYAGQEGIYAPAFKDIHVVIEPMKVVIVPSLASGAVFYDEMTEEDVLAQIEYKVYQAEDPTKEVTVDKNTVWGTGYDEVYYTQPYEPVFSLQYEATDAEGNVIKDEAGNSVYYDNNGYWLDSNKKYRVVFSGKKDISSFDDMEHLSLPINTVVNTTDLNYLVDTDYENAIVKYALTPVTVEKGKATRVEAEAIIAALGNKGASMEDPYVKQYDGTPLYEKKADYKKASVKAEEKEIAKNTDESITYMWYRNSNESVTDDMFSYLGEMYEEGESTFDNDWYFYEDGFTVPTEPGIYRLNISYRDTKAPEYLSSGTNVYYVIEYQPIKAVFNGEYKALVGQPISDFIESLYMEQEETTEIQVLSKDQWVPLDKELAEEVYLEYVVTETMQDEKVDEEGNPVTDAAGNPVYESYQTTVNHFCYDTYQSYDLKDAQGKPILEEVVNEWDRYNDEVFKEDAIYELTAYVYWDGNNYTDFEYVIKDYYINNPETGELELHKLREKQWYRELAAITVEKMGETALSISVNALALGEDTKVYDGEEFDIASYLGNAISFKKEDGSEVTGLEYVYYLEGNVWYEADETYYYQEGFTQVVDAGSYDVWVSYPGSTEYKAAGPVKAGSITITPAPLKVTPVITEEVPAGKYASYVWSNRNFQKNLQFEGVAPKDQWAFEFTDGNNGYYYAFIDPSELDSGSVCYVSFNVYEKEDPQNVYGDYYRGNKEYILSGSSTLALPFSNNYKLTYEEVTFTAVRGVSSVIPGGNYRLTSEYLTNQVNYDGETEVTFVDTVKDFTHTIVPVTAIPYSYYYNEDGEKISGNFLQVIIEVPQEYGGMIPETAVYKNVIEAVGGKVYEELDFGEIEILLDASKLDKKTFTIRWEDGYTETFVFDFTNAELMGDLSQAVAPKTIAFQSPATKMAVGEMQNLDLKLTKVQQNDIIYIIYKVSDESVLAVDNYGTVTALKEGKAVITAAPAKNINGEAVLIDKAKTAKVTITVKPVTTPKIKKVASIDTAADVDYGVLNDGYRREVYVLEGKNLPAATFEEKISSMKSGDWRDIFATAPEYFSPEQEQYLHPVKNGKIDTKTVRIDLDGLEPSTTYTVYLRNVSAVRKAEEDSIVTLSAVGKTKSFTTSKPHVVGLEAGFANLEEDPYTHEVTYVAELSKGKVKVSVDGLYAAKITDPAMDETDEVKKTLPLKGQDKKLYAAPKLTYSVYEKYTSYDYELDEYIEYRRSTAKASVDKKGNVKLLGIGVVYVGVNDTNTGEFTEVRLRIEAKVDTVKGSNAKLSVGQGVYLRNLLTYFNGKKKVASGYTGQVEMNQALIDAFKDNQYFTLDTETGYVRAIKEGGKLKLTLTEAGIKKNGGKAEAAVTLTSRPLEAVKSLKVANAKNLNLSVAAVTNEYAVIQFEYSGSASGFKIEVKDQRGNLIRSSFVSRYSYGDGRYEYQRGDDNKYYYTWRIDGLTQQSTYQVTMAARYDDITSKPAQLKFKTTRIPISDIRLNTDDIEDGHDIYVMNDVEYNSVVYNGMICELYGGGQQKAFTSGNKYQLGVFGNTLAESSGSDSLIWTSSNAKVASIKAVNNSSYANLQALRAGETVIEVKSKLTKEVIARRTVRIMSVGDAYGVGRRYFNENTPDYLDIPELVSPLNLTPGITKYISVMGNAEKLLLFTAPKTGMYRLANADAGYHRIEVYDNLDNDSIGTYNGGYVYFPLEERQAVYVKVINYDMSPTNIALRADVKEILTLRSGQGLNINGNGANVKVSFTALEDGEYEFKLSRHDSGSIAVHSNMNLWTNPAGGTDVLTRKMVKGETIYLNVHGYNYDESGTFTLQASLLPEATNTPDVIENTEFVQQ